MRQNPCAALGQPRIAGFDAHQLGRGVALDRERDVARPARIYAPTAVFVLVAHHLGERALKPAWIAAFQLRMQIDVVGLEHRIGFQFPTPIPIGMLLGEQELRERTMAACTSARSASSRPNRGAADCVFP